MNAKTLEAYAASLLDIGSRHGFTTFGLDTMKAKFASILADLGHAESTAAEVVEEVKPVVAEVKAAVKKRTAKSAE